MESSTAPLRPSTLAETARLSPEARTLIAEVFSLRIDDSAPLHVQHAQYFKAAIVACIAQDEIKIRQAIDHILPLKNREGKTLFMTLVDGGHRQPALALLKTHAEKLSPGERTYALHQACRYGWTALIAALFERVDIETTCDGKTPLHTAIESGQNYVVEALLDNGASPALAKDQGLHFPPATYAARCGEWECLELLLNRVKGAAEQRVASIGSILHVTIHFGQSHLLEDLLDRSDVASLINNPDAKGRTPFSLAALLGDLEAIALLRQRGADLTLKDWRSRSAVHWAARGSSIDAIKLLDSFDLPLDERDQRGRTPAESSCSDSIRALLHNLEKRKAKVDEDPPAFPIHPPINLALSGGDLHCFLGAVDELFAKGLLSEVRRLAALSNGALLAALLALNVPREEHAAIIEAFTCMPASWDGLESLLTDLEGVKVPQMLFNRLASREPLGLTTQLEKLEALVERYTDNSHCTLGELRELSLRRSSFKELHLFGWSVKHRRVVHFDPLDDLWQGLLLSDALALCLSIPGLHEPRILRFKDAAANIHERPDLGPFLDAGPMHNRLLETFDETRYLFSTTGTQPVYNRRTFGITTHTSESRLTSLPDVASLYHQAHRETAPQTDRLISIRGLRDNPGYAGRLAVSELLPAPISPGLFRFPGTLASRKAVRKTYEHFTGRKTVLDLLQSLLAVGERRVIVGPPGIGKSELACAVANRMLDRFPLVFWMPSETKALRDQAYRKLARSLKLRFPPETPMNELQGMIFDRLEESMGSWLLIYDNVEEEVSFPERGGSILVTSRRSDLWPESEVVPLSEFNSEEAAAFVQKVTERDAEGIEDLAAQLGTYPIVLDKVAQYMRQENLTIREYLLLLEEGPFEMKRLLNEGGKKYTRSLQRAWALTFKRLSSEAIDWLQICAYLNPATISQSLLERWLEGRLDISPPEARYRARSLRQELVRYSVAQYDNNTRAFHLHRLTQEIVKADHSIDEYHHVVDIALSQIGDYEFDEPLASATGEWLPHLYWLASNAPEGCDPRKIVALCDAIGVIEQAQGCNHHVLVASEAALKRVRSMDEIPPLLLVDALISLGEAHHDYENSDTAIALVTEAKETLDELLGDKPHKARVRALKVMGAALFALERDREALAVLKQALSICDMLYGDHPHPQTSYILLPLGEVYAVLGDLTQASEIYERALAVCEDLGWHRVPQRTIAVLLFSACSHHTRERYPEALKDVETAEAFLEEARLEWLPLKITAALVKSSILMTTGQSDSALACLLHGWAMIQDHFGDRYPHHAIMTSCRLVTLLMTLGQRDESLSIWHSTLKAFESIERGEISSANLARSRLALADVLQHFGEYDPAIVHLDKAERALRSAHEKGAYTRTFRQILRMKADMLLLVSRHAESLLYYERTYALCSESSLDNAQLLQLMGLCLTRAGRYAEAVGPFTRSLEEFQALFGPDHARINELQMNIQGARALAQKRCCVMY